MLDSVIAGIEAARNFLVNEWPGGSSGQWLADELLGLTPTLLSVLVGLILLLVYFAHRAWTRARAIRRLREAQAETPELLTVLVLAPSGFGLALSPSLRRDRDAFHAGLVEGLTEGMLGFAPHARMQAFRYPASSGWPARREAREIGASKLRRLQKRAQKLGADLIVASDRRSAVRASAVILPRSGEGWFPLGLTLSEAPEKANLYLAQAVAFHAAGLAAPDAPPFTAWKSADRDRLMEQLAPLILNPPADKPENWADMLAAFDACGDAALQRDYMSKQAKKALVLVRRAALEQAADGPDWARAVLALALTTDSAGASIAFLGEIEKVPETAPRAAYLRAVHTIGQRDWSAMPRLLAGLREGDGAWHRAGEAFVLEVWSHRLTADDRKTAIAAGIAAAGAALSAEGLRAEEVPLSWAALRSDFTYLLVEEAQGLQSDDAEATRRAQCDAHWKLWSSLSEDKSRISPENAPRVIRSLLAAESNLLDQLFFHETGEGKLRAGETRLHSARQSLALVPEGRAPTEAALARLDLAGALNAMGRYQQRTGWLDQAADHFSRAEKALEGTEAAIMARIDGASARVAYLLLRWNQAAPADKATRAEAAEEGLTRALTLLGEQRDRKHIPLRWRAVASGHMARVWEGLAELHLAAGRLGEAASAFDQTATERMASAAIYQSLGDVRTPEVYRQQAAAFAAQADALREAERAG